MLRWRDKTSKCQIKRINSENQILFVKYCRYLEEIILGRNTAE